MNIVVDASLYLSFILPDEPNSTYAHVIEDIVASYRTAHVPPLFFYEVANGLLVSTRRGRLSPDQGTHFLALVTKFPAVTHHDPTLQEPTRLAVKHGLTLYDASYLALAVSLRAPLVTLDAKLALAATKENVNFKAS